MANPFENIAREHKVLEIVTTLRVNKITAGIAAGLPQRGRDMVAAEAGQHAPSEKTWTRVVEVMERLEATAPADPFEGVA